MASTKSASQSLPTIPVHELFSSIQGEGLLTGTPMTFIRLWGCNMQPRCPWCDTPQTSQDRHPTTVQAVVAAAHALNNRWACITGGEPTIHPAFDVLVESLQAANMEVAVETNGTREFESFPDWICVSPKVGWIEQDLPLANEIKVLVGSGLYDAEEFVVAHLDLRPDICLQPVWPATYYGPDDNTLDDNLQRAIELCHKYRVRLSVQLHKLIGVR